MKNYRYFADSEGLMFVMMSDNEDGVILDTDGTLLSVRKGHPENSVIRLRHVLRELDVDYLTDNFVRTIIDINKNNRELIDMIVNDINTQKAMNHKTGKYDDIPNAVMKTVNSRIASLTKKIPLYKNDVSEYIKDHYDGDPKRINGTELRELMMKYPATIRNMTNELAELEKFVNSITA